MHFRGKALEAIRDMYTYDTPAWTYYKNNQLKEALEGYQETLRLGTKNANLFFHAGMIYYKLGNMAKAKEYLNQALSTNPHFHTINSEVPLVSSVVISILGFAIAIKSLVSGGILQINSGEIIGKIL